MVYCVAYNCAKKHTSKTNDYIRSVSAVKTRPKTTTTIRKFKNKSLKRHSEGDDVKHSGRSNFNLYHWTMTPLMKFHK